MTDLAPFTEHSGAPSNARLLQGVQTTLQKMMARVTDDRSRTELGSIDVVMSELLSREQTEFYANYYQELRLLLLEGLPLIRANLSTEVATTIDSELDDLLPATPEQHWEYHTFAPLINRLLHHLAALVRAAPNNETPEIESFLKRVVEKENQFHARRVAFAAAQQPTAGEEQATPITLEKLQTYLQNRWPERRGLRVTSYKRPPGGYQKTTILFETEDDDGRKDSLALRAESKSNAFIVQSASDISDEYEIVRFVYEAGVTVAEPMWFEEDETKLGSRFFVSKRVNGENYGSAVAAGNITEEIARSYVEAIAKVHQTPVSERMKRLSIRNWIDLSSPEDNTRALINYWRHQPNVKATCFSPIMERLVSWLMENVPRGDIPMNMLHGDFGPHNILVENGKVTGILDWESPRYGDPAEDISWFLQSCGGKVDYGQAIAWYEEFTGHRISEYRLRYYDVLGCLKIVACAESVDALFERKEQTPIIMLDLSFRFGYYGTSMVEKRIRVAESVLAQKGA